MRDTQSTRLLEHLLVHKRITGLEALRDLGIMSCSRRICDLKSEGIDIKSRFIKVRNRFGEDAYVKQYELECDDKLY